MEEPSIDFDAPSDLSQPHHPLADHLRSFKSAPYLFVGAGLSHRYLGTESWEGLLRRYAAEVGKEFEYFRSSSDNSYPVMGQLIAELFHDTWWSEERFAPSRMLFKEASSVSRASALKIEVSQHLAQFAPTSDASLTQEMAVLKEATVDGIITTNYDNLLESLFPAFVPYTGQDGLLFEDSQGVGEIYKIHGSIDSPNSLVLTARDYEEFEDRKTYLAAKLLTIFVESPVIFLGYSMSDPNVLSILRSIARCLTSSNVNRLRDRLIFIEWNPSASNVADDQAIEMQTIVLDGMAIPARRVRVNSFQPVYETLRSYERQFSVRLLRHLRKSVYELVRTENPSATLQVIDFDSTADLEQVQFVAGIGVVPEGPAEPVSGVGYRSVKRRDLLFDVLDDNQGFDSRQVVEMTLPEMATGGAFTPVYKYLDRAGLLDDQRFPVPGAISNASMAEKVAGWPTNLRPTASYIVRVEREKWMSVDEVVTGAGEQFPSYVTGLPLDQIDAAALAQALLDHPDLYDRHSVTRTGFAKAVCLVDYLLYGPGSAP